MWKIIICNENYYLMKTITNEHNLTTISLTDLISVWSCQRIENDLMNDFKNNNPLCAESAEDINTRCYNLLNNDRAITDVKFSAEGASQCKLYFKTFFDDLPLKLSVHLMKQTGNDCFKLVQVPLVQTIQYLEFKQNKLESLLAKKDKEILEYKMEFGEITRKLVETETYVPDTESKKELFLKVFSENENFTNLFSTQHGDVQQLFPEIKQVKPVKHKLLELAPVPPTKKIRF